MIWYDIQQYTTLHFIIIPTTCFGPIVGPSSGWSLNRRSVQLTMLWKHYQLYTPPVQRPAWRWPYNWAETCSCNYILSSNKIYSTRSGCLAWKWPGSCSGRCTSVERDIDFRSTDGCVGTRTDLDALEKRKVSLWRRKSSPRLSGVHSIA